MCVCACFFSRHILCLLNHLKTKQESDEKKQSRSIRREKKSVLCKFGEKKKHQQHQQHTEVRRNQIG